MRSSLMLDRPVMFPPGRAKLLMKPKPIGLMLGAIMIGTVDVAFCAAAMAGVVTATIASGRSAIRSLAMPGKR